MPRGRRVRRSDLTPGNRYAPLYRRRQPMDLRVGALVVTLPLLGSACAAGDTLPQARGPVPVVFSGERPVPAQRYLGPGVCRRCHGKVFQFWEGTAHAGSYASLAAAKAEKEPSCLRCHSTGFGEFTGFVDAAGTPELSTVSCESCHGPGGDHAGSASPAEVPTAGAGDCSTCEVSRVCRLCHTTARSPDFVLATALQQVSCSKAPED